MSVQKQYDRLVKKWGRELANEIMRKRAAAIPFTKNRASKRRGSPVLPGSFENGKQR